MLVDVRRILTTKLSHANGQFSVVTSPRAKDKAVAGAVHRLQGPDVLLNLEGEHVLVIV
jgi:hypothetical protein